MQILVINNHTSFINNLLACFEAEGYETTVVDLVEIANIDTAQFDLILLSGGHNISASSYNSALTAEEKLILNTSKPLLGICFGFELIARVFGSKIEVLPKKEKGEITIHKTAEDPIFNGANVFKVYESHRYCVRELGSELVLLASSKDGIEIFKHISRPVYGFQFHPEMHTDTDEGYALLINALHVLLDPRS